MDKKTEGNNILNDIGGFIKTPVSTGRFKEILSTQKIVDTYTDIEYDGLVEFDLLEIFNELNEENQRLQRQIIDSVKKTNKIPCNCNPCVMEEEITKILFDEK